eukprot:1770039-Pyramimonas_sp.AAC.1
MPAGARLASSRAEEKTAARGRGGARVEAARVDDGAGRAPSVGRADTCRSSRTVHGRAEK